MSDEAIARRPLDRVTRSGSTATRLLRQEVRPVRLVVAAALTVLLVSVLATLTGPLLVQRFVDRATAGAAPSALMAIALTYLAVALVGGATRVGAGYLAARSAWQIADSLRVRLLRRAAVERPVLEVERQPVGEVLERVEGNCDIVGKSLTESGFQLIGNLAVVVGTLTVMAFAVPAAGAGIAVLILAGSLILTRLARRAVRRWELARDQQADLFGFVGDSLAAREDLLPLGRSRWATATIQNKLTRLLRTEGRAYIGGRAFWPLTQLFSAIAFGLGFGFGLLSLSQGSMSVGTLMTIYLYVNLLQTPMEDMSSQWGDLQKTMAVLGTAARTLDEPLADGGADRLPPGALPDGPLDVAFDHVTFGYGDVPVVRDVSFTVEAGRSLGIVGQTGAGKSTLLNLLCGLASPDEGHVRIGGVDVDRMDPAELATRLTVLSQRAHIFADSVRDNLTLFDDSVAEERIWHVLEQLDADGWIRMLPDGLDTVIGASGRALSEGEMQVIACARALIRPVGLLVVDEGVSKLDPAAERTWSTLLGTVMKERTVIMVEHRQTALTGVDRVVEMADGRITYVDRPREGATK
ncbi:ABC transporter ATP-binding protein [Streptomyces sp. NRRL F-5053]|uniref:ABC transporter ATP-binding protein n=1 Tax=Streptomyces sp. NRRL F-5053 TaxID=1463854 RepID=UPI00068C1261|nr:ABC transporter ATP-binding protein [Streptomyces sp. NRRL F-5053]